MATDTQPQAPAARRRPDPGQVPGPGARARLGPHCASPAPAGSGGPWRGHRRGPGSRGRRPGDPVKARQPGANRGRVARQDGAVTGGILPYVRLYSVWPCQPKLTFSRGRRYGHPTAFSAQGPWLTGSGMSARRIGRRSGGDDGPVENPRRKRFWKRTWNPFRVRVIYAPTAHERKPNR